MPVIYDLTGEKGCEGVFRSYLFIELPLAEIEK